MASISSNMLNNYTPAPFVSSVKNMGTYDFKFLSSPKDPRLDGKILQGFDMAYFNSEPNTSFSFRYRPFEAIDGMMNGYEKTAERKYTKGGQGSSLAFTRRRQYQESFTQDTIERFGIREVFHAIQHRNFDFAIEESLGLIQWVVNAEKWLKGTNPIELDQLYADLLTLREGIYTNLQLSASRKEEWFGKLLDATTVLIASPIKDVDALEFAYQLASLVEERESAIVVHHLMIGTFSRIRNGLSLREILVGDTLSNQSTIGEYRNAVGTLQEGYKEDGYTIMSPPERFYLVQELSLSEKILHQESITIEFTQAIVPDRIGIYENITIAQRNEKYGYHPIEMKLLDEMTSSKEGWMHDTSFSDKSISSDAYIINELVYTNNENSEAWIVDKVHQLDMSQIDKEVMFPEIVFFEKTGTKLATIDEFITRTTHGGKDVRLINVEQFVEKPPITKQAQIDNVISQIELIPIDAWYHEQLTIVELIGYNATPFSIDTVMVGKVGKDSRLEEVELIEMTLVPLDSRIIKDDHYFNRNNQYDSSIDELDQNYLMNAMQYNSRIDIHDTIPVSRISPEARIDQIDVFLSSVPIDALEVEQISTRMNKIGFEAWLQHTILTMPKYEKVALIRKNWDMFLKVTSDAYEYRELQYSIKLDTGSHLESYINDEHLNVDLVKYDTYIAKLLEADDLTINGYILDMIGAKREQYWQEVLPILPTLVDSNRYERNGMDLKHPAFSPEQKREGIELEVQFSPEQERIGIIQELINAHDKDTNHQKEGYVPAETYILTGDGSDWEDIWNRYSPGVDILDPPDSDFDYSKLASVVYDQNGVPHFPIGATNLPEVRVSTPLHHPLPENYDLGIDDTKVLAVDNYIFIDVTLALESLKNRNTLRYAGMPAEKTVRELFSKLFTWIQQAAPNHPEYDRMFRFARWYAESAVIKLSKHILHRTYNSWRSKYHLMQDLGIPYTSVNWDYSQPAVSAQTTSTHAEYKFGRENYIDGELILMGYFDNPLNEGTMKIVVDGTIVKEVTRNGAFTERIDVPQGNHTYELIFDGASGRVSLSTIEITGCEFVSAYTTSDDSDTNGLKACSLLINNLLSYFDTHHGGGKVKGTMEIKQRRVWNVQT